MSTQGYVSRQVRDTTYLMLFLSAALLLGVAGAGLLAQDYYYNIFKGPFPAAREQLLNRNPDPRRAYLAVDFGELYATGFGRLETRNKVKTGVVNSRFYAAPIGGRLLVVEIANNQQGPVLKGELKPIDEDTRRKVVAAIEARQPRLAGRFAPVMFVAAHYAAPGHVGLAFGGFAACLAIFGICKAARRVADPHSHPAYQALAKIGDPQTLEAEIDAELAGPGARRFGPCRFTANWVLVRGGLRFKVMRVSEVLWVYRRFVRHYYNGIPVGKKHFAVLCDRHGARIDIPATEAAAEQLVAGFARMAPWAAVGFSNEASRAWRTDRASMAADADGRKRAAPHLVPALAA